MATTTRITAPKINRDVHVKLTVPDPNSGYVHHPEGFWFRVQRGEPVVFGRMAKRYAAPYVAKASCTFRIETAQHAEHGAPPAWGPVGEGASPRAALNDLRRQLRALGLINPNAADKVPTMPPPAPINEDHDEHLQWAYEYAKSEADEQAWLQKETSYLQRLQAEHEALLSTVSAEENRT